MKPRKPQSRPRKSNAPPPAARTVSIEKPVYGGSFLARDQGKSVFVPLTLPGEEASVSIIDDKANRGYARAELLQVLRAVPERIRPECPHFGPCGGCHYQQAGYATQLDWKQTVLRETLERGSVPVPEPIATVAAEPWAYRNRIRLAFDAEGRPGYRGRRSHAVVPVRECPIAAPLLVKAALAAAELVRDAHAWLRPAEISLFCDAEESSLLMSLSAANPTGFRVEEFAQNLRDAVPQLTGAELVTDPDARQQARTVARWGASALAYSAAGLPYRVDQGGFFQVNRWLVDQLVACVTEGQQGALAWDLFAGVGLFARRLAQSFAQVVAVESAPAAAEALAANLEGAHATAVSTSVLDFLRRASAGERPDLICVDPPRTGLGGDVTHLLNSIASPRIVYVSCDPATLARDLRALLGGGYNIESLTLVDLFPQTFHLETVVHLRRA